MMWRKCNVYFSFPAIPCLFAISHCPIARHHTIKDIEENSWSHDQNVRCRAAQHHTISIRQPCFWSHDFNFLHKPIVYGVAHLLYGVALSASVNMLMCYTLCHCFLDPFSIAILQDTIDQSVQINVRTDPKTEVVQLTDIIIIFLSKSVAESILLHLTYKQA